MSVSIGKGNARATRAEAATQPRANSDRLVRTRSGSLLQLLAADVGEGPEWLFLIVPLGLSVGFWQLVLHEEIRLVVNVVVFMALLPGMFFLFVIWNVPARAWLKMKQARAFRRPAPIQVTAARTERVRLVGFIEPDPHMSLVDEKLPVVYARTLTKETPGRWPGRWREEIRGIPFHLRLSNGTTVRLDPGIIELLDRPARLGPGVLQVALSPGDEVEAIGTLCSDVSPTGESAPCRGVPMVSTMLPRPDERLWLRRVPTGLRPKRGTAAAPAGIHP
jgi:hypothetical protein